MKASGSLTPAAPLSKSSLWGKSGILELAVRLLPFLLPVMLLLPAITAFPYPSREASYSDLAITHYPNAIYLRDAILRYGSIPLWSPTILSGYPFAANPLSGIWYPFGWLALLMPLPFGFNMLVGVHLLWGGIGFYRLMRAAGLSLPAALIGAMVFESMPKMFAHYGAGHITLIFAVSWTPWLLLASQQSRRGTANNYWKASLSWALPALILALIFLADVRWTAYGAILWWGYVLWQAWERGRMVDLAGMPGKAEAGRFSILGRRAGQLLLLSTLAFALAAPLALPLLEYTALSTRSNLAEADVLAYSLPPARLLGLFFPDLGGFHEWILYPGWVVLSLGLLAVLWKGSRSRAVFWIWAAVISLFYSLGEYLPLLPDLSHLPLFDLLRVPPRSLFIFGIAVAVLAGYGLDALLNSPGVEERKRARLLLVFLLGLSISIVGLAGWLTGEVRESFAWGLAALTASAVWIWLSLDRRIAMRWTLAGFFLLCFLDLGGVNLSLFTPRPSAEVLSQASTVVEFLSQQPGSYRVYSPSYSLPQQSAAQAGLRLADGVDPLQLKDYAGYMESASGVLNRAYSVALPPYQNGDPNTANLGFSPNPHLLGMLNVRYVAAEYDLSVPGLALSYQSGSTRLYENSYYRPQAWVQPAGDTIDKPVEYLHWSPNRIEVEASGPGLLVLSEISYPGWQVLVDGEMRQLETSATILRAVNLEPGKHQIVFQYRPTSLYIGLGLAAMGVLLLVCWSAWQAWRLRNG